MAKSKFFVNKFQSGLTMGTIIPIVAIAFLFFLDKSLVASKSVSLTGNSQLLFTGFKESTLLLMAICFNLIPTYFANKKYMDEFIRGIMIPTVVFAFIWFFRFRESFF